MHRHQQHSKISRAAGDIGEGTIVAAVDFDCSELTDRLKGALSGFGTDEDVLTEVLTSVNCAQRQKLQLKYDHKYRRVLIDKVKNEASGRYKDTAVGLLMEPLDLDVETVRYSIEGLGTDNDILVYFMSTNDIRDIRAVAKRYKEVYDCELAKDIADDTSGDFRTLLMAMMDGPTTDDRDPHEIAQDLYEKTSDGDDAEIEDVLPIILQKDRDSALAAFDKFADIKGMTLKEAFKLWFSGNCLKLLKAIATFTVDPDEHHAKTLRYSTKGLGTRDRLLIYVVLSRAEIDLETIKQKYLTMYERTLEEDVADDLSGDYKRMILAVIRGNA